MQKSPWKTFLNVKWNNKFLSKVFLYYQVQRMKKMDHFFNSIASLMSNLLRSCVISSIYDLVTLIEEYREGNRYEGEYTLFQGLALPTKIHIVHFFMVSVSVSRNVGDHVKI